MRVLVIFSFTLCLGFLLNGAAYAEETVNTTEGIGGYTDAKQRNPVLSVRTQNVFEPRHVKIMADAYVPDGEFSEYPMRFDFFVNRKLFSSQFRSKELPGAVGVDVGTDVAEPPFNYTVIATVLHPNKNFTTILNGAVFATNLRARLDCVLEIAGGADESAEYEASQVEILQAGDNLISLSFTGKDSSGENSAQVQATLTISGVDNEKAAGSLTIDTSGTPQTVQAAGTVEYANSALSGLEVSSDDGNIALTCSSELQTPEPGEENEEEDDFDFFD